MMNYKYYVFGKENKIVQSMLGQNAFEVLLIFKAGSFVNLQGSNDR